VFLPECGGYRWQRIPPTEKRGRYQTSTITVAVVEEVAGIGTTGIRPEDLEWKFCRGSGNGGQHRNKTDSAVHLLHRPTGIRIWCEEERSQPQNKRKALERLAAEIERRFRDSAGKRVNDDRRQQIGSGMRGDKIRTIRVRDNTVTNHLNGGKVRYTDYVCGDFGNLTTMG
jgi:peptide chain release factor 1